MNHRQQQIMIDAGVLYGMIPEQINAAEALHQKCASLLLPLFGKVQRHQLPDQNKRANTEHNQRTGSANGGLLA